MRDEAHECTQSSELFDGCWSREALSLAANRLVLHHPARTEKYSSSEKPAGCVHSASVRVHATDAANAWRNIARVCNHRNQIASLIVRAFHTAGQTSRNTQDPYPYTTQLDKIRTKDAETLLSQIDKAVRSNDRARAFIDTAS